MSNFKSLNDLDKKMLKYINFPNGFFIEMGANDGVRQSNSFYYDKSLSWSGVLIEPTHRFDSLVKNRSKPNNILLNEACCSFDNEGSVIEFEYCDLMTTCSNLKTDVSQNHTNEGVRFLQKNEHVYSFKKRGVSLQSLLDKNNCPNQIDFFSLDVEGLEIEVLKGIDFSSYHFSYILIESRSFDELTSFLYRFNYSFVDKLSHHDYLYKFNA
jgi:FkbM family methyltransferase